MEEIINEHNKKEYPLRVISAPFSGEVVMVKEAQPLLIASALLTSVNSYPHFGCMSNGNVNSVELNSSFDIFI